MEHLQEFGGFAIHSAKLIELLENERPGEYRKDEKNSENNARHSARLLKKGERAGKEKECQARNCSSSGE